jgi:hypothetical protein
MILFKLKCADEHEFEGWFRDNATYDRQAAKHQIACPDCGSTSVTKAPMAPRLARSRSAEPERPREVPRGPEAPPQAAGTPDRPPTPAELRRAMQVLRKHVEANCEHVGPRFAEEARRIHRGEAEARGIYGDATPAESRALADEGIEIAAIPWVPASDA